MSGQPASSNELSPQEKRALLEKLLKEKAAKSNAAQDAGRFTLTPIQTLSRDQKYFALSTPQQRLWLLDQLDSGNPAYNISLLLRFMGPLDVDALKQALTTIQQRHEILRVNFTAVDGEPVQFIVPDRVFPFNMVDITDVEFASREDRAGQLAEEDSQRTFDLGKDSLARANLFRLAENNHLFQFVIHHIVFDGWSLSVFLQELTFLYSAALNKQNAELPPLEIQYIDFADWEAKQFNEEQTREHLEYWKKQLNGNLPVLDMPLDNPRPNIQSFRAGKETLDLTPALTDSLNALSRQEGVTLFMTMLSVFYILLARYTAQEDIIVGTPIARRSRAEVEKLIGVFINNLALRTDLSGNITFRELLKRVRRTSLDAFAHQDIPFERLLNELRIERNTSHSPVFQVFFNLLDVRKGVKLEMPNLEVETPSLPEIGSIFDITLYVQNWGETLKLKLVYNADLFTSQRMSEFLHRYHQLLEEVLVNPNQSIFQLPLASQVKQRQAQIVEQFDRLSNGHIAFKKEDIQQSLPLRFEQQVEKFGDHTAIQTPRHQWTYRQLNQMSNHVAHTILERCDTSHERVALLFDHDAPMVAGLLGVLKAGKTYIPLDPNYPHERLAYMLGDSRASAIVTNGLQLDLAKKLTGDTLQLINIDELQFEADSPNPGVSIAPDILAYILYTSGSTGQPKGVIQNHRNVLHFMRVYTNNLHIGPADKLSLLSSYSFDAAVMDIFGALLNGATLYPIDAKREGLVDLASYLNKNQITIYHSTPTVYRYFVSSLNGTHNTFPFIRLIVLGGEAVIKHDVDLYKKHFAQHCVFINGLGPTESTVSLQYFIDKDTQVAQNAVSVGYPVDETEVLLLNEAGENAILTGEIAIQSPHIALGYWQQPELTQSAFRTDSSQPAKRMYRTGDLGRLLPDGTIEFRGRKDFQVKIRGHRVEVGEIETRLTEYPKVKECVVNPVEDANGEKFLVAYFVHNGDQPTGGEMRSFLQQKLPDYMIPVMFIPLERLPLTPTGKIDRRALPAPDLESRVRENAQVSASNETQEKLVKIWEELLHVHPIGIRDNFFELGGHSLMAVHMFAQIHQEFNVNLPLATLFREATIEHLANVIQDQSSPNTWSSLIEIEPAGDHPPFFCVHGITGDILWFRDLAHCLAPDYPFYGLQSRGLDGIQDPLTTIEDMAAHYIEEIRKLQPNGPYYLGGASFGGAVALEIAQQLMAQGEEVSMLAIFDHSPPNVQTPDENNKLKRRMIILSRIVRNFPAWIKEFIQLGPSKMWMRIRRKLRLAQKVRGQADIPRLGQFDAEDLIDFASELSPRRQQLITFNFQAIKTYVPKPYSGNVTLFRAMNRPLFNTRDPQAGWQVLAPERVQVHDIPGSHEGMFKKPHVYYLAEKLRESMDRTSK